MTNLLAENDLQELGRQIQKLRKRCNLSISDLALEAGINDRTVQNVEKGSVYQIDNLQKILGILNAHLVLIDLPEGISIEDMYHLAEQISLMKKNNYEKVLIDLNNLLASPEQPCPDR